jgi:hypothetical protein
MLDSTILTYIVLNNHAWWPFVISCKGFLSHTGAKFAAASLIFF